MSFSDRTIRWRLKIGGHVSLVNVYLEFNMTVLMYDFCHSIDAKVYPLIGVVEFKRYEDITAFRLKFAV